MIRFEWKVLKLPLLSFLRKYWLKHPKDDWASKSGEKADLIIFPELSVIGYPAEDYVQI